MKKKPKEPEKESGERWLVTYSDLITLLLVFFIIMYASAESDTEKMQSTMAGIASAFGGGTQVLDGSAGDSVIDGYSGSEFLSEEDIEERNIEIIEENINAIAIDLGLEDSLEVFVDSAGVHIRIKDAVLFNSGSYTINKTAIPIMEQIGETIKKLPNNYIQVEGHTDDLPINKGVIASNWELGGLRAVNVTKMLISNCALSPKYISAVSYGEYRPIINSKTDEARAKNRRVEITILRNFAITK